MIKIAISPRLSTIFSSHLCNILSLKNVGTPPHQICLMKITTACLESIKYSDNRKVVIKSFQFTPNDTLQPKTEEMCLIAVKVCTSIFDDNRYVPYSC